MASWFQRTPTDFSEEGSRRSAAVPKGSQARWQSDTPEGGHHLDRRRLVFSEGDGTPDPGVAEGGTVPTRRARGRAHSALGSPEVRSRGIEDGAFADEQLVGRPSDGQRRVDVATKAEVLSRSTARSERITTCNQNERPRGQVDPVRVPDGLFARTAAVSAFGGGPAADRVRGPAAAVEWLPGWSGTIQSRRKIEI